jgi:hypothetical protein
MKTVMGARLPAVSSSISGRKLIPEVGTVLALEEARMAHEMLAGAPHKRGKIVLTNAWRSVDTALDARRGAAGIVRENQRW